MELITLPASDKICFRKTEKEDLEFVLTTEHHDDNKLYVFNQTANQHQNMLTNDDILHLIIMEKSTHKPVGYVILAGFQNKNKSIELKRIVISQKGQGYGREAIRLCKQLAFEMVKAHRLWLDVVDYNQRAQNLYLSEGFVIEGKLRECDLFNGEYHSLIIMSILEKEYKGF